jgi:four helix bundle protein
LEEVLKNLNLDKQSTADFVHKLEIALREGRETRYWLRLPIATELMPEGLLLPISVEVN